ncbi:hypothetical protein [Natronococcus sp. A-GB7]|nr:hypothetical protein [Natronococcus sp. A-GB7]MDG5821316.1 hypothetical protein [Natronococcus sp. A-GB7]
MSADATRYAGIGEEDDTSVSLARERSELTTATKYLKYAKIY